MNKLFKDTNGAITVFVSLLLIPAILISGTAVDLARIYTARSIIQDANQLAGNSILTQYEAMIQDIYGLYGVMEDDPILGEMINEYIQLAVFGEEWQDKEIGSFQLFYGSEVDTRVNPANTDSKEGQSLNNPDVLRRQIEEYAKFRAPVIIVEEIWERIEEFKKLKADSEVIEQKLAIDDKVGEIDKIYKEIYHLIEDINKFPLSEQASFDSINEYLIQINTYFKDLKKIRDEWRDAHYDENSYYMYELEDEFEAVKQKIELLIHGEGGNKGFNKAIDNYKTELGSYIVKLEQLVKKCAEADRKKLELSSMVDELERKLDSGNCSEEIIDGMTKPQVIKNRDRLVIKQLPSMIDEYRTLLSYSLEPMAEAISDKNTPYINYVIEIINGVEYGSIDRDYGISEPRISRTNLGNISRLSDFMIDIIVTGDYTHDGDARILDKLATLYDYKYMEPKEFKLFQDSYFDRTHNNEYYKMLERLYDLDGKEEAKEKDSAEADMKKLTKNAQNLFKTISLTPKGAPYYKSEGKEDDLGFGSEGNWANENEASDKIKVALKDEIFGKVGDLMDEASNKILLLTYGTEMFSNFTTIPGTKTMSGIPMDTDVNYFFQSELEYLYNGNQKSARSNIATVTGLIFLVRFVFNYTSTFVIDEIRYELELISAPTGPYAIIARELARIGYALAESAIDMKELLEAPKSDVPLFKVKMSQWKFSLHRSAIDAIKGVPDKLDDFLGNKGDTKNSGSGMYYIDYLRIFLLLEDGDILADRIAELISWNITNKKEGIKAKAETMASTALFDMSKVYTDFMVTSTVELRMLFLSMPFAQKGIEGVIPRKSFPIEVVDYRGY